MTSTTAVPLGATVTPSLVGSLTGAELLLAVSICVSLAVLVEVALPLSVEAVSPAESLPPPAKWAIGLVTVVLLLAYFGLAGRGGASDDVTAAGSP